MTLPRNSARLVLAFLLLSFNSMARQAPVVADSTRFAELERTVVEEIKATNTPGAAVAIIKDGRLVFAKGFGVGSVETGSQVTADTLFRLGSTTKMFTGAALVRLAEKGRLKLDTPIGTYVKALAPELASLTAHQLASNTSGLADISAPFISHDDAALSTMVRSWKGDIRFTTAGKIYSYSSAGFWLAGYVIEELSGKAYADTMAELIFQPLGMRRTTFRPLVAMTYPLALGHEGPASGAPTIVRPAFNNVAMWPAGSIYSSAEELSRFVMALFAGGQLATVLPHLSGHHALLPGETDVYYGYGLMNFEQRGVRVLMHGGFSRGYGSMIQMVPAHRFAVIVLTNRSGQTLNRTTEKAKELFLPLTPAPAASAKKALPIDEADLRAFVGTYVNGSQVWQIVARQGRQLALKLADAEFALSKVATNKLAYGDGLENELVMVPGGDGKAEYLFDGLYASRRKQ